jgi:murein DD-endopeptidase MepM/ murein hydrolase activator NlpD
VPLLWVLVLLAGLVTGEDGPPRPADAVAIPDPRWEFYTDDRTVYTAPWYDGAHRIMVPFGCNAGPYYAPDPRCRNGNGFHHGIDVAMPCGTRLFAGRRVTVASAASLGPAYGTTPLLLRTDEGDVVIGHTRKVFVEPGDVVRRGQLIALASDNGAPDGCHLHFELRARGGGLESARWPRRLLDLAPVVR